MNNITTKTRHAATRPGGARGRFPDALRARGEPVTYPVKRADGRVVRVTVPASEGGR